jgi:2-C-methyl-D-erythritol 4-phosphate cytidylyltransferase / 2-C-methyl-D-erythritol 2,4-cyclodiphosphate synthase
VCAAKIKDRVTKGTLMSGVGTASALIVAAGRGARARRGADGPKQYVEIGGRAVLARAIAAFAAHPRITHIQIVIHAGDQADYDAALGSLAHEPKLLPPVYGGTTRQLSVLAGLKALERTTSQNVLIHDAARPFLPTPVIDRVLSALLHTSGAIAALPLADTLKRAGTNGTIVATVPRDNLWRAQTPQGFRLTEILAAHRAAAASGRDDFTDDAAVAEWHGLAVQLVMGDPAAVKLTTPEDIDMAELQHGARGAKEMRIGQGFDVHSFTTGNHVWLCGVKVPHSHGVEAHSDGDVALHALTDALLGAIADGDIGQHFKNTDPRWRGASSDQFLTDAVRRVTALGGRVINVDITVLSEAPKIAKYRDVMRARMAEILSIPVSRIGLKATTAEQLGAIGRREGLAAMAVAMVEVPQLS